MKLKSLGGLGLCLSFRICTAQLICSLSFVAFAALSIVFFSATCQGQNGVVLFHKMQTALGGSDKIAAIQDFEQCVRADAWNDEGKAYGEVYKRTRWIRPNVLRLDQTGPGNSYALYFNGVSGWEILPDKGFVELGGEELAFARGYLNGIDLKTWLSDRDSANVITASSTNVIVISTTGDDSQKTEITLDPVTFLPVKEASISLADASHAVATKTRQFEGWEAFQGVKFPHRIINFHGEKKVADMRLQQIKLDGGIRSEDLAIRPQGLKPVMSQCGK